MSQSVRKILGVSVALLVPAAAVALTLPNTFSEGDALSASQMNANFDTLRVEMESLQAELADLRSREAFELGETTEIGSVLRESSSRYQVLGDGLFMTRPGGGSASRKTIVTDTRICQTASTAGCLVGPRASAGGDALTFSARAGEYVTIIVEGGENEDGIAVYWTPLTAETAAPTLVE